MHLTAGIIILILNDLMEKSYTQHITFSLLTIYGLLYSNQNILNRISLVIILTYYLYKEYYREYLFMILIIGIINNPIISVCYDN